MKTQKLKYRFFSIVLLGALLIPVSVVFIGLKNQQRQIRKEVKWKMIAGIDKSELVLLKFTKDETESKLRWKHSGEFQYLGDFYDIVETAHHDDSVYYWCWLDRAETELNCKLQHLLGDNFKNNSTQKSKHDYLKSFIKSLFVEDNFCFRGITNVAEFEQKKFRYKASILNFLIPPPSPPPQNI